LQFDNWLFGTEMFSGLSRNKLLKLPDQVVMICSYSLFFMYEAFEVNEPAAHA